MCRSTLLTTALLLGLCSEAPAQDPALPAPLLPLAPAAGPVGLGASSRRASSVPGRVFPKETVGGPATKKQDLRLIQVDPLTLNESDPVWGLPRGGRRIGFLADDFGPLSDQGEYRRSWRYEFGTAEVVASVAFPFQEGNEPTAALRREGWVATRRAIEEDEQGRRLVLDVEDGKGAHACFLQKDVRPGDHEEGAAPGLVARLQVWRPETRRWLLGRYRRPAGYVLEVLVIAEAPLADQGRDEARRFLADFENALKTQATGRPSPWGPS